MNKDEKSAIALTIVYFAGVLAIWHKAQGTATGVLVWVIWTLGVVIYALLSDYIEDVKDSVHKQAQAVYKAEMNAINERDNYWSERGERE